LAGKDTQLEYDIAVELWKVLLKGLFVGLYDQFIQYASTVNPDNQSNGNQNN
jgi:hypothetical protein